MIISFVIPVYNTDKYLAKCIGSILEQDVSTNLYEIILVNDGSTDNSPRIINVFSRRYDCIKSVHTDNNGLGAARNIGMAHSRGKYIFFVDSDDYLPEHSLSALIKTAKAETYDIIGFDWNRIKPGGRMSENKRNTDVFNVPMSGAAYLSRFNLSGGVWSYLFSSSLLKNKQRPVRMPEGIYHEDELFLPEAFLYAKQVLFIDKPMYVYNRRSNSIMLRNDDGFMQRRFNDYLAVLDALLELPRKDLLTKLQQEGLRRKTVFFVADIIRNLIRYRSDKARIDYIVGEISKRNLYPMVKEDYGYKYNAFRLFFNYKSNIVSVSKVSSIVRKLSLFRN